MSIALQIGQLLFVLSLLSAVFILVARGRTNSRWPGSLQTLFEDAYADVKHLFAFRIFKRLDDLNNQYEALWKNNQDVLRAVNEYDRVPTSLYSGLYDQLTETVHEGRGLGKDIALIFQETDASIQHYSLFKLAIESVNVELKRSRLELAAGRIKRLEHVMQSSRDIYEHIKRVPADVELRMERLRKSIKQCLLENIDVVEAVKEHRIKKHLKRLATILEEREVFARQLSEIVKNDVITREDRDSLSRIHNWLLTTEKDISNARAEFRSLNQAFTTLSLMEQQIQSWYDRYDGSTGTDMFEEVVINDLEKRVVALKELWQGYEQDIQHVDEPTFEDRNQRVQFILDEVERFDQDINVVNTCRAGIEDRLSEVQKLGGLNDWIDKMASMCPFTIEFDQSDAAARVYEKAIIQWDNPRPYLNVPSFVDHAKRVEEEIARYGTAIYSIKDRFRHVKSIEAFHSTLKDGLLKQQTSAALVLYQYAKEELNIETIEWNAFDQLIQEVELLLQDNPVASAQRHDPISEELIPGISEEVEQFKVKWEHAFLAIQENYKLLQSMLRKDIELMGTQWITFMYNIQDVGQDGYIAPFSDIPIAEPTKVLHSLLNTDGFHESVANLEDAHIVAFHRELCRLSVSMNEAVDRAERIAMNQKKEEILRR